MIADIPPGLILILGAILVPLLPAGPVRKAYLLLLPVAGLASLLMMEHGNFGEFQLLGYTLIHVRVDALSFVFGVIFYIATFVAVLYALHSDDVLEQTAALAYAGAAIGAAFAGDLITLFVYWELTALTSVFIIWAGGGERAQGAGMRYLIVQIMSGVLLAGGAVLQAQATGSLAFNFIGLDGPGGPLIFLAFGIKCAFPLMHNWLQDAYPEASPTGTVFLSAFTTKLAVYALARGYPGTELLVWIGAAMTAFPIFFAVIENDLRRVLAYSLNNQLGFMVAGVGIGTQLAINGAVSHAFAHILYKALLFMAMGAVLYRVGTAKGSELGGLYKSMPWTTGFCIVGSAAISGFPLFSGFVTKSMILTAAAEQDYLFPFLVLLFASAGVFHHSGIKIPFFAFFAHDSGKRPEEAPINMLLAMAIAAMLCFGIGVYPQALYAILPYPVDYVPYTTTHVVTMLQLLMFSALAFAVLQRTGLYPPELRSTILDFDWLYRKAGARLVAVVLKGCSLGGAAIRETLLGQVHRIADAVARYHGPIGVMARSTNAGTMAVWVLLVLALVLMLHYL
jgi:multicomponent Na+:H+ antiporter subunit D